MKEKDGTKAKTKNGNEASERKRKTEILEHTTGATVNRMRIESVFSDARLLKPLRT